MSLLPYSLLRPALFQLDAERAHELTLKLLAHTQRTPWDRFYRQAFINDPLELAGLHLPNRVGMAAGLDKNASVIDGLAAMGFGFIEVGTVTPLAQAGNPTPRLFRLPKAKALINRLGFNNQGLEVFIHNVQQSTFRQNAGVLGLNIGKNAATPIERAADDYLIGLAGVYAHADYVTINISSPNTQNLRTLQSDVALDHLLHSLNLGREQLCQQHGRRVPIFVKIAPDLNDAQIEWIVASLIKHQMDGVIATNTTLARTAVQGLTHANETGGLSGAPLLASSNQVITLLRAKLKDMLGVIEGAAYPIIGVGGILSAQDALSKIACGAHAVQIYSGLIYRGPSLVTDCARALSTHPRSDD